jgi:hypothetical protein
VRFEQTERQDCDYITVFDPGGLESRHQLELATEQQNLLGNRQSRLVFDLLLNLGERPALLDLQRETIARVRVDLDLHCGAGRGRRNMSPYLELFE